jgi:hypothetical protein
MKMGCGNKDIWKWQRFDLCLDKPITTNLNKVSERLSRRQWSRGAHQIINVRSTSIDLKFNWENFVWWVLFMIFSVYMENNFYLRLKIWYSLNFGIGWRYLAKWKSHAWTRKQGIDILFRQTTLFTKRTRPAPFWALCNTKINTATPQPTVLGNPNYL